ncbi:MAG: hypothetical protein K2X77_14275 [Candidatus Obscuribacterales bacterium]|nr:hypothetical protein [Candidatus Obscuribacterales bacterium]
MADESSNQKKAADKASKEWLRDYLHQIYGVSFESETKMKEDLKKSGQHITNNVIADDFVCRLLSRFNDIDSMPSDGFITITEIENAIAKPQLHLDKKDVLMLQLLRKYFFSIKELSSDGGNGISRKDIEYLSHSLSQACTSLRALIEKEFEVKK